MGKLNEFSIQLASPQAVYYPGQVLAGNLVVDLNDSMEMRSIKIKISGKGYCHWSEEEGTGDDRRTVHYKGRETLVKQKTILFGANSDKVSLPAGKQVYFFSFTLPSQLPSSFEGSKGHIRYVLKGEIDKPWKFDHKVKLPFTVNELIDTNNPMYSASLGGERHKEVGCMCCKAGPLDLSASIDRGAYCPGEAVLINANVANQTTRDMKKLYARLIKRITYHASNKSKTINIVTAKLGGPEIPSGECAKWENQPFGIPATAPTIRTSRVVTVEYDVEVIVDVPWGFDPCVKMNIVMGTIPFIATYGRSFEYGTPQDQQAPPEANYINGPSYAPPPPSVFGYPDMPPPSYSAVAGTSEISIAGEKDKHTYGQMNYSPVYTFAQPYQGGAPPFAPPQYPALSQPPPYAPAEPAGPSAPALPYPPAN